MLSGPEPVTALFAGNNRVTVTAVRVLAEYERRIALVGFDDIELADLLGITVISQDAAAVGRTAAEHLFRRLDGADHPPVRVELPTRLIPAARANCRPPDASVRGPAYGVVTVSPPRRGEEKASRSARVRPVSRATSAVSRAPQSMPRSR